MANDSEPFKSLALDRQKFNIKFFAFAKEFQDKMSLTDQGILETVEEVKS